MDLLAAKTGESSTMSPRTRILPSISVSALQHARAKTTTIRSKLSRQPVADGADLNAATIDGRTAMTIAAAAGHRAVVRLLRSLEAKCT